MLCFLLIRQVTVGDANYMDWTGVNNHYRTAYKGISTVSSLQPTGLSKKFKLVHLILLLRVKQIY